MRRGEHRRRRSLPRRAPARGGGRDAAVPIGEPPPPWRDFGPQLRPFALPLALALATIVHYPALMTFFAQDDITFLARARGLVETPWSLARPLSEGILWRAMNGIFGLDPFPYHLLNFALHLANTALVFVIGRRLLHSQPAAFAAALLFGASSIAFTPLHWVSCVVELTVTTFTLAAFQLYLVARGRSESTRLAWLSAAMALAALLSKESAILFPLVLVVAQWRLAFPASRWREIAPQVFVTLVWVAGVLATLRLVHYAGSETYSMSRSPDFIALNLATYLRWLVALQDPVRDLVAAMYRDAWLAGLAVGLGIAAMLWTQRRERHHPEEVAAVWFLAFLAPVVALRFHTYLYYLYLPWPGICWLLAGAGRRAARRFGVGAAWVTALALAAFTAIEFHNVRARESLMLGPLPADKTVREGTILRNVVTDLRSSSLDPGDRIAFVNTAPRQHVALADTAGVDPTTITSYLPIEGALRGGEAIRVFFPGVEYLGFAMDLPPEWEDAQAFLYQDEGLLRALGSGSQALAELGYFTLRVRDWEKAERMFLRSRERGDTLADATFGLIITSDFLGRAAAADRYAAEFLRRWPNDERAPVVAEGLQAAP